MTNRNDQTMHAFATLRQSLKDASIDAIQQDMYEKSRQIMELMEALAPIENRADALLGGSSLSSSDARIASAPPPVESRPRKPAKYPRFYRNGDTLYKEGMRQDGKSIYTQKVGLQAFEAIATAVANQKSRKFKPSDVIEQVERPSYQVYIVLNVLQNAGLVDNPERGSYRVMKKAENTDVASLWGNIQTQTAQ